MFSKFRSFFKNFFRNVKADPMGSAKGVAQLSAAGATCYGMANGAVPVNEASVGFVTAMTASGLHALGTDSTNKTEEVKKNPETIVEQLSQMKAQAEEGQQKVDKYTDTISAVHSMLNR